jgi:hypothetical protein
MKTYRIPFSRIHTAWLRRSLMVLAYPLMVLGNWLLILWAAAKMLMWLPFAVLVKAAATPFQLRKNFVDVWHGREPEDCQTGGAA